MLQLRPLDEVVPIQMQLGESVSPVVLINIFHVALDDVDALLKAWEADANWMKKQPGLHFDSTSPWYRRKLRVPQLRCLGVSCSFPAGFLPS